VRKAIPFSRITGISLSREKIVIPRKKRGPTCPTSRKRGENGGRDKKKKGKEEKYFPMLNIRRLFPR